MANAEPKISFLFPYRWLKEDRAFLGENIRQMVIRDVGKDNKDQLDTVLAYRIVIFLQYGKPLPVPLTKPQIQSILKPLFSNARCLSVDASYQERKGSSQLPLCDMRIYF